MLNLISSQLLDYGSREREKQKGETRMAGKYFSLSCRGKTFYLIFNNNCKTLFSYCCCCLFFLLIPKKLKTVLIFHFFIDKINFPLIKKLYLLTELLNVDSSMNLLDFWRITNQQILVYTSVVY